MFSKVSAFLFALALAPVQVHAVGVPKLHRGTWHDVLQLKEDAYAVDDSSFIQRVGQQPMQKSFRFQSLPRPYAEDSELAEFRDYLLENASTQFAKARRLEQNYRLPYQKQTFRASL